MDKKWIKRFLKPDRRKIIVFLLVLLISFMNSVNVSMGHISLPIQYEFLNEYIFIPSSKINLAMYPIQLLCFLASLVTLSYLGFILWDIVKNSVLVALFGLCLWYIVVCLIVSVWNRLFRIFGEKTRRYEIMAVILLITIFVVQAIIAPYQASNAISIETYIPSQMSANEIYDGSTSIVQTTTVKNGSFFTTKYEMPDVHLCLYDVESESTENFGAAYRNGMDYLSDINKHNRNIVSVKPFSEEKVYLKGMGWSHVKEIVEEDIVKHAHYDEILFLQNIEDDDIAPCVHLSKEEIRNAERIKIIK